jgi:subtilisin family serine protease
MDASRRTNFAAVIAALGCGVTAWAQGPAPAPMADRPGGWASDRVLVRMAPGARVAIGAGGTIDVRSADGAADVAVAGELAAAGARGATRLATVPAADAARAVALGLDRWQCITLPRGSDAPGIAARLVRAAGRAIELAEVDPVGGIAEEAPRPDDTRFVEQWALENTGQFVNGTGGTPGSDVRARAAWHVTTGDPSQIIAVLDSGVNQHADLAYRVLPGWNVVAGNDDTTDRCASHGTHCAGIAAAGGNDAFGVAGMAWRARVLPVVVVNPCSGLASWLADGLVWAADHGATVMSVSLQYSVASTPMLDAVRYAQGAGAMVVASAGNTGTFGVAYPAKWDEVIAVGSIDQADVPAATTAVGPEVDVAAPGVNVLSTVGVQDHGFKSGTSMAAPHVAGTIALMRAVAPTMPPATIRSYLASTCTDVFDPGIDWRTGRGRIDAAAAVRATRLANGLGDLNGDGAVDGTDLGTFLSAWGGCGTPCPADFNDDGIVDGGDLFLLLGNWGGAD